jgi:hypothetical protein
MDNQESRRPRNLRLGPHPVVWGIVATVAMAGMVTELAPRLAASAASAAPAAQSASGANDAGIGWSPGSINETNDGNGGCYVNFSGDVTGADPSTMDSVYNALADENTESINQDGIKTISWNMPPSYTSGSPTMVIDAEATVDCSLIGSTAGSTGTTTTTNAGMGSQTHAQTTVIPLSGHGVIRTAAVPAWLKGALGALAGAAVYVAVSAVTVATMVALGATLGPGGALASPALAALAGCIGGATSTAVTLAIAGATTTPLSAVAGAVAGCVTGGAIGSLPVGEVGPWLANQLGARAGTVGEVAGAQLQSAASGASVSLTPIQQAMQDSISSLGSL